MLKFKLAVRILCLLALAWLATSCASATATVPAPTADENLRSTAAAKTAVVKSTLLAYLNPSATPEGQAGGQAVEEPTPGNTPETGDSAGATPPPEPTPSPEATARATTAVDRSAYPTATPRRIPDAAEIISSSPLDGAVFNPGNSFDAVWTVRNTGSSTWTPHYYIRFARGENMSPEPRYYLKEDVRPGETVNLVADMVAPGEAGLKVAYWEFVNGNGDIIFRMYVAINVE